MQQRFTAILVTLGLLVPSPAYSAPPAQDVPEVEDPQVREIMEDMSAEQRVGQLFLVTFNGTDATADSAIGQLVREERVGGVVLSAANDNFTDEENLAAQILQLTNDLQALATGEPPLSTEGAPPPPPPDGPYIPLFIAIERQDEGALDLPSPAGLTPLTSGMAIGATWDPLYAEDMGRVIGQELDALGINMLFGPSLDVLEEPQTMPGGDLGVRTFGGDPYWVAQMGAAYVSGVHRGSQGRVAVVPEHFPGLGSADRPTDVEVSTVPRSLARLIQVDLAPFFAVTGVAASPAASADGLLTAHIRYLGFQGDNPRLATRPISLDPQALQVLMGQAQLAAWREDGGLLVSGALGQRSIRRFYDPSESSFPHRKVAQDAFLAGNDILYLAEFGPAPESDQTQAIVDTIEFFVQKYDEDPTFRARVDAAVARIIRQKLDQFGSFSPGRVQRHPSGLADVGQGRGVTVEVAQAALTLLSPSQAELVGPPAEGELIVIFTDTRPLAPCSTCEPRPIIPVDALSDAILRLYGPEASGLLDAGNVQSYSFAQLDDLLEFGLPVPGEGEPTPEPNPVEIALGNADWVVFMMLDVNPEVPHSGAVKRFLAERADIASSANIVVMAMDAPYYLDSTEISKLSAYYALYGTSEAFVDTAARALFQEILPGGASPVTVSGINYDLLTVTSPEPTQVIELYAGQPPSEAEALDTPEPLEVDLGDTLHLRTGVILDRNGNPVPDGTPVDFDVNFVSEGLHTIQHATTVGGVAESSLVLERVGQIEVTAVSEPAQLSFTLFVNVQESGATIFAQPPEVTPTATQVPTTEPPDEQTDLEGTPTPSPPVEEDGGESSARRGVTIGDLVLTLLGLLVIGGVAFRFGQRRSGQVNDGLFHALPGLVGGLLVYNLYAFGLPGQVGALGMPSAAVAAWGGGVLGFAIALGIVRLGGR